MAEDFIRRPYEQIPLTQDQLVEMARLYRRPNGIYHFIKYIEIQTDKGMINFADVIKDYQYDMIKLMQDNDRAILLASRQMSKTTISAFYLFYECCFPIAQGDILIVAHKGDHAREVLRRFKNMYYSAPNWLKPGLLKNNEGSMEFDNGMRIFAEATTSNAGRGKSIKIAYCVDGTSKITVRNKETGEIREIDIADLYNNDEYK